MKHLFLFFILFAASFFSAFKTSSIKAHNTIKVAIIDTGLDLNDERFKYNLCEKGHQDFTGTGIEDRNDHGTHVAGLIQQFAEDSNYCLIIIKFLDTKYDENHMESYLSSLKYAVSLSPDFVNLSLEGSDSDKEEQQLIRSNPNIKFIVAAGNNSLDLNKEESFPASYGESNMIVVGSLNWLSRKSSFSNYGSVVTTWEYGERVKSTFPHGLNGYLSGTSMAAAIQTGKLVKKKNNETYP